MPLSKNLNILVCMKLLLQWNGCRISRACLLKSYAHMNNISVLLLNTFSVRLSISIFFCSLLYLVFLIKNSTSDGCSYARENFTLSISCFPCSSRNKLKGYQGFIMPFQISSCLPAALWDLSKAVRRDMWDMWLGNLFIYWGFPVTFKNDQ